MLDKVIKAITDGHVSETGALAGQVVLQTIPALVTHGVETDQGSGPMVLVLLQFPSRFWPLLAPLPGHKELSPLQHAVVQVGSVL